MNTNETSQYADYKNDKERQGGPYSSSWGKVHKNYKREEYGSAGIYKSEASRRCSSATSIMKKFNGSVVTSTFSLVQCHEI